MATKNFKTALLKLGICTSAEFEEYCTRLDKEFDIRLEELYKQISLSNNKVDIMQAQQPLQKIQMPTITIHPSSAEKPKKAQHFIPKNIGRSVKTSQKPLYKYRRR